jgi:integrase
VRKSPHNSTGRMLLAERVGYGVVCPDSVSSFVSVLSLVVHGLVRFMYGPESSSLISSAGISLSSIELTGSIPDRAQLFSGQKEQSLARKRYQNGSLYLRKGKRRTVWVARWLEDVIEGGHIRRVHRREVLGTFEDFPTRKLARRELDARLAIVNSLSYRARPTATFFEFSVRWEATVLTQHKPSTQATIRSHVRKYLVPFFGSYSMRAIQTEDFQRLLSSVRLSPKTVRNLFSTFQMMWKSARAWGYVAHDSTLGIVLPRRRRTRSSFFTLDEVQRIIAGADEPYRTFYWLAAETGMRAGELCGLRAEDCDLQARLVRISQSVWRGRIQGPKTENAYRSFALSPQLVVHLATFIRAWSPNERHLLFVTRNGTPWDANLLVKRKLRPLLRSLGIEAGGLHAFRHANATIMDSWNVPLKVRQQRLGHSDSRITLDHYTHVASEDDVRIAAQLGKALSGGIPCPVLPN